MMKRIVTALIGLMIIVLLFCAFTGLRPKDKTNEVFYAKPAVLTTINTTRGYVGFTDDKGDEWYWYTDTTDAVWSLDTSVLLVMSDSGTEYRYDDAIVSITVEGIMTKIISK